MSETAELDMRARLRAQLTSPARKKSGTVKGRKALEKRAMSPADGRLKRIRGETKQLNVEIDADLKERIVALVREHRHSIVELTERGLELALLELERGTRFA